MPLPAAEALFLPLTERPWVEPTTVAAAMTGGVSVDEGAAFTGGARVEGNIARRVSVAVRAELTTGASTGSVVGGGVRAAILDQEHHGLDLGAGVRYRRDGWATGGGEIEGVVSAGRSVGRTELLGNLVVGAGLAGPEKDGELSLASLTCVGDHVLVGADARARLELGAEEEGEEEGGFDATIGPVLNVRAGPVTGLLHAGATVAGEGEEAPEAGFEGGIGVRVGF